MKLECLFKIKILPKKAALVKTGARTRALSLYSFYLLWQLPKYHCATLGFFGRWFVNHSPKPGAFWIKVW